MVPAYIRIHDAIKKEIDGAFGRLVSVCRVSVIWRMIMR